MKRLQRLALLSIAAAAACTGVYSEPFTPTPGPTRHGGPDGKLVFATSKLYQGGYLGGFAGADAVCNQHATDAGLGGAYKAWLSAVGTSAAQRMTHATKPYVLVDGTRIADDWTDLIHADLEHPINLDEQGALLTPGPGPVGAYSVWTNTLFSGEAHPWTPGGTSTENPRLDCMQWDDLKSIGLIGLWSDTGASWTGSSGAISCTEKARLYCFEQ